MARRIVELVEITDDVTGEVIPEEDADTVRFSVDGMLFKLETSQEYADGFRDMLAKYVALAQVDDEYAISPKSAQGIRTRTAAPAKRTAAPRRAATGSGHTLVMVRSWAQGEGYDLGDRGRIPASIQEAYAKAHGVSVEDLTASK
ncbi:histone-like nucleoid-structuring protein Lsr2 [Streptomyces cadmiisoli]|uniref:Lsr2 family protein n=1 Tax=Streptomyces cadmiisoli TaxID=2184053 RepID=A0A2Z4J708_9ACTN|nr:Lsr2 family protein [Streptomyces cadmiisoli]AWW40786.1 hypothetical protein DN051_32325 [Streptomyces cadmiisoli]